MGDSGPRSDSILGALTSEHFVMQSAINASVSEQQARASMYLLSVSGALVAIGFMARSEYFVLFVSLVLPALFVTGLLTTLRLVDIAMESAHSSVTIARIRSYYRSLGRAARAQFDEAHGRWPEKTAYPGSHGGPMLGILTTAASMIACVNAIVGAALVSLLSVEILQLSLAISIVAGAVFAFGQVIAFYLYQRARIHLMMRFAETSANQMGGKVRGSDNRKRDGED